MSKIKKNSFAKQDRLKSKKAIEAVFSAGESIFEFPIRLIWMEHEVNQNQSAFAVSKKRVKLAVDRNKIKRQMREAYRLNQSTLCNQNKKMAMVWIYTGKDARCSYRIIANAMEQILQELSAKAG